MFVKFQVEKTDLEAMEKEYPGLSATAIVRTVWLKAARTPRAAHGPSRAEQWAIKALEKASARAASAPFGKIRDTLNSEAFNVGGLVGAGLLFRPSAVQSLVDAGMAAGLAREEAEAVVSKAITQGMEKPIHAPYQGPRHLRPDSPPLEAYADEIEAVEAQDPRPKKQ